MPLNRSYAEIVDALSDYFDGFHHGDIAKLKRIFHENCHLYTAGEGNLQDDDMEAVYARVAGRTPPAASGAKRQDEIVTIDKSSSECAFVKLRIAIPPRLYTDYLTLLLVDGRWRIISKTYSWVPLAESAQAKVAAE